MNHVFKYIWKTAGILILTPTVCAVKKFEYQKFGCGSS